MVNVTRETECLNCGGRTTPDANCLGCKIKSNVRVLRNGCWRWSGATRKDFGIMRANGVLQSVHRIAWGVWRGDAPYGAQIEQTCGNHDCVNPDHLYMKIGPTLWESIGF